MLLLKRWYQVVRGAGTLHQQVVVVRLAPRLFMRDFVRGLRRAVSDAASSRPRSCTPPASRRATTPVSSSGTCATSRNECGRSTGRGDSENRIKELKNDLETIAPAVRAFSQTKLVCY